MLSGTPIVANYYKETATDREVVVAALYEAKI